MFFISSWSLFHVQSYLPLSIINHGISKHYAGSQVSDRRPFGYLLTINSVTTAVQESNRTSQISLVTHDAKGEMHEI